MDPLCVRRRFLFVGCLLWLLWPGIQRFLLDIFQGGGRILSDLAAIALFFWIFSRLGLLVEDILVTRRDDLVYVGHAAIA